MKSKFLFTIFALAQFSILCMEKNYKPTNVSSLLKLSVKKIVIQVIKDNNFFGY